MAEVPDAGTVLVRAAGLRVHGGTATPAGAVPALGELAVFCRPVVTAPTPHRTDCCRSIRWREGVKGGFACTLTRQFPHVLVVLRSQPPLMLSFGGVLVTAIERRKLSARVG